MVRVKCFRVPGLVFCICFRFDLFLVEIILVKEPLGFALRDSARIWLDKCR